MTREKSLMPKVEANAEEMRNLVAYVSRLTAEPVPGTAAARRRVRRRDIAFTDIARPKEGSWPTYDGDHEREPLQPS